VLYEFIEPLRSAFSSREAEKFSRKLLKALRSQIGGHELQRKVYPTNAKEESVNLVSGQPACDIGQLYGVLHNPLKEYSILLLDPLSALFVLLVLLLDGAPGNPVAAILLVVLLLCGVVRRSVDLLGVLGQIVPYAVRQVG